MLRSGAHSIQDCIHFAQRNMGIQTMAKENQKFDCSFQFEYAMTMSAKKFYTQLIFWEYSMI
jgi:hypothetical protein